MCLSSQTDMLMILTSVTACIKTTSSSVMQLVYIEDPIAYYYLCSSWQKGPILKIFLNSNTSGSTFLESPI